jgi:hypothetical protein
VISAFARMLGRRETVLRVEETPEGVRIETRRDDGAEIARVDPEGPPPAFTQSLPDEGGTVVLSPMVEALREWLAKLRREA